MEMVRRWLVPALFLAVTAVRAAGAQVPLDPLVERDLVELKEILEEGGYAEADSLGNRLRVLVAERLGERSIEVAAILDFLVDVRIRTDRADDPETLQIAERAVALKLDLLGDEDPEFGDSLENLAEIHRHMHRYEDAETTLLRAATLRAAVDSTSVAYRVVLERLGLLYTDMGRYRDAEQCFDREMALLAKGGEGAERLPSKLYNYGRFLYRIGEYEKALAVYGQAEERTKEQFGAEDVRVAYIRNGRGIVLDEVGRYSEARTEYEAAIAIAEIVWGPRHSFVANCRNNLGFLNRTLGDYDAARGDYEEALEITVETRGWSDAYAASTLSNLAEIDFLTGDFAAAESRYRRALSIRQEVFGVSTEVANSLEELGGLLLERGEFVEAESVFVGAQRVYDELDGESPSLAARPLLGLAKVMERTGRPEAAWRALEDAYGLIERNLGARHPKLAEVLTGKAWLALAQDRHSEAVEFGLAADEITRSHIRETAQAIPERQALKYASIGAKGRAAATLAASAVGDTGTVERVWDAVVRSRALVLEEVVSRNLAAYASGDSILEAMVQEYARASRDYAHLLVSGEDSVDRNVEELEESARARDAAERRLALRSAGFRRDRERTAWGLEDVRAAMPAGAAMVGVAHVEGQDDSGGQYVAFVLGTNRRLDLVPLGPTETIDTAVREWRAHASNPLPDETVDPGLKLRRLVWDPIAGYLQAEIVFLVLDGSLNLVNWYALPSGGGYLIEESPLLHCLTSEKDVVRGENGTRGKGALILGGVDFGVPAPGEPAASPATGAAAPTRAAAPCSGELTSFERLSATSREVQQVVDVYRSHSPDPGEVLVLEGGRASEARIKEAVAGKRILHLATHGFILSGSCQEAPAGTRGLAIRPRRVRDTARSTISGLALAGANVGGVAGEEEDGILTEEEIASLNMIGLEWAVLSACDTGMGTVQSGEGVLGLRRAFRVAGAGSLIMSLWAVADEPTMQWMTTLYRQRFEENLGTARAVRNACLIVLQERRASGDSTHPFYWSSFIAAGDWR